ncbi:MAG: L,D-transpeptidase family protein [Ruminococcus sp.]|nr:L,D-transpeptidase family protein [Ruminococcus sp.]
MYEKNDGVWQDIYSVGGIVGLNGVSAKSGEGDYRTPKGIFTLGFGFGTEDLYNLGIEYRKLNENCYWVDDPQSDYYNLWVESDDTSAWNSAEHLIDYPSAYHYAVVIDYNTELIKGAGSAIFLHCAVGSYTAGCVAVPDDSMYYIINWLDSSKDPKIIIY